MKLVDGKEKFTSVGLCVHELNVSYINDGKSFVLDVFFDFNTNLYL